MDIVAFLTLFCIFRISEAKYDNLLPQFVEDSEYNRNHMNLTSCVQKILTDYYEDQNRLTYINLSGHNDDFLDDIHSLEIITVLIRNLSKPLTRKNKSYLIMVENEHLFAEVEHLNREILWNPYAKFLVIIYNLHREYLHEIFNMLLHLRVINVVVMNGTETTELYTYNPFENYGCGKNFTRIIEYGRCNEVKVNIYPEKILTGLERCTFRVTAPHWPPFSIDPSRVKPSMKINGIEQELLQMMSKKEKFTCVYKFDISPEFSLVFNNATIDGPLVKLQTNEADIMLGGRFLTPSLSKVFYTIHGHLDFSDEVKVIVRKAETLPPWLDIYLEFSTAIWALLIAILVLYSLLLIILIRTNDRVRVPLVLLDTLLQHGATLTSRPVVNLIFIIWVWFAYLVNCFYISSLMSHTTKPEKEYQIKDEEGLIEHDLEPCLWGAMQRFINTEDVVGVQYETSPECYTLYDSLYTVSRSKNRFTVAPYYIYLYNRRAFYNKYGESPYFLFDKPVTKLIYAIYFYNGFPVPSRFHMIALQIKESGVLNKVLDEVLHRRILRYHFEEKPLESRFVAPWRVYVIGVSVSVITFVIEIATIQRKR